MSQAKMKFKQTNKSNKNVELTAKDGDLYLDGKKLEIKQKYFTPCTGSRPEATLTLLLNDEVNGDNVLFLEKQWNYNHSGEDDRPIINKLNESIVDLAQPCKDELKSFEARPDGSFDPAMVFVSKTHILCPLSKSLYDLNKLEAVFLERVSSYTRSFDVTLVFPADSRGKHKTFQFSAVDRKKNLNLVKEIFTNAYETGPDPIPWSLFLKKKKDENLTWDKLHKLLEDGQEEEDEEEDDWKPGETDEDEYTEDEEYDYPEDEELEDDFEDDESESDVETGLEGNEDYDKWNSDDEYSDDDEPPKKKKKQ